MSLSRFSASLCPVSCLKHRHTLMHMHETLLPEDIGLVNAILRRYVTLLQTLHQRLTTSQSDRGRISGLG